VIHTDIWTIKCVYGHPGLKVTLTVSNGFPIHEELFSLYRELLIVLILYTHLTIHPPHYTPTSLYTHLTVHPPYCTPTSLYTHLTIHPPYCTPTSLYTHLTVHPPYCSPPGKFCMRGIPEKKYLGVETPALLWTPLPHQSLQRVCSSRRQLRLYLPDCHSLAGSEQRGGARSIQCIT